MYKTARKETKTKQYLRTNTSLHIGHIYISEIILATFSLKSFFTIIIFSWKKKCFPSSVLNSTAVGFWTGPTLRNDTQRMRFSDFLSGQKKINISKVKSLYSFPLRNYYFLFIRIQRFNIIQWIYGTKENGVIVTRLKHLKKTQRTEIIIKKKNHVQAWYSDMGALKLPELLLLFIFDQSLLKCLEYNRINRQ